MLAVMVIYVTLVLLFPNVFEVPWLFCSSMTRRISRTRAQAQSFALSASGTLCRRQVTLIVLHQAELCSLLTHCVDKQGTS